MASPRFDPRAGVGDGLGAGGWRLEFHSLSSYLDLLKGGQGPGGALGEKVWTARETVKLPTL